ncbi:MAG TPA: tetratricopeptide repeat protein [Bryobacteraceae bacterium]|nr:tetratricopeptide repeat protein [Bryobacteraceae bacterium]
MGLVYQRTNRRREAEVAYRRAAELAPESPEPLNALGSLKSQEGRISEAEKFYRGALAKNSNPVPARHNLALLLAGLKDRDQEAVDLLKQNLTERPDFLPSRLALAELMAKRGDSAGAIEQYRMVIAARPEYVGARVALATQLLKASQPEASLEQLQAALKVDSGNASLWEQAGDAHRALRQLDQSRSAYTEALKFEEEKAARKRIRAKMAS